MPSQIHVLHSPCKFPVKADTTDRKPGRLALCLVIVGVAGALAGLWWASSRASVSFLPDMAPAMWIIYPVVPEADTHPLLELPTTFEHSFAIDAVPPKALLRIAGFHRYTLSVNGASPSRPLRTGRNWKQPDVFDVAGQLRPGANRIEVTVLNSNGPPALWLSLGVGMLQVNSGEDVAVFFCRCTPVLRGSGFRLSPVTARSSIYGLPRPLAALGMRWPTLLGFALLSAMGCWLLHKINLPPSHEFKSPALSVQRLPRGRERQRVDLETDARRGTGILPVGQAIEHGQDPAFAGGFLLRQGYGGRDGGQVAHATCTTDNPEMQPGSDSRDSPVTVLAGSWLALFANNLGALPHLTGFDAQGHMDYIGYIAQLIHCPWPPRDGRCFRPRFIICFRRPG